MASERVLTQKDEDKNSDFQMDHDVFKTRFDAIKIVEDTQDGEIAGGGDYIADYTTAAPGASKWTSDVPVPENAAAPTEIVDTSISVGASSGCQWKPRPCNTIAVRDPEGWGFVDGPAPLAEKAFSGAKINVYSFPDGTSYTTYSR